MTPDAVEPDIPTNIGQEPRLYTVNLHVAKSKLVERAAAGEEIIIAEPGRPLARLVPLAKRTTPRPLGLYAGQVKIGPDFDDPFDRLLIAQALGGELTLVTGDKAILRYDVPVFGRSGT